MYDRHYDDIQAAYRELPSGRVTDPAGEDTSVVHGPNDGMFSLGIFLLIVLYLQLFYIMDVHSRSVFAHLSTFCGFLIYGFLSFLINGKNAGVIPKDIGLDEYLRKADPAKLVVINEVCFISRWCSVCRLYKPPRSKHCYECKSCVERYDHHCVWLSNCIGIGNVKLFFLYLLWSTLLSLYSNSIVVCILVRHVLDMPEISLSEVFKYLSHNLLCCLLFLELGAATAGFGYYLLRHSYLIACNLTNFEYATNAYPTKNPFSQGFFKNIASFCRLQPSTSF